MKALRTKTSFMEGSSHSPDNTDGI